SFGARIKYMDNETTTEETSMSDIRQKKIDREMELNLDYYFHLNGHYRNYTSNTSVDAEVRKTDSVDNSLSAWISFLSYLYFSAKTESDSRDYNVLYTDLSTFDEREKNSYSSYGFGLTYEPWRMRLGYSPESESSWEYYVGTGSTPLLEQKTKFKSRIYEFVKNPINKEGFYADLYYKKTQAIENIDQTNDSVAGYREFIKLGYGYSEMTSLYLGISYRKNRSATDMNQAGNLIIQDTDFKQSFIGLEYGFNDETGVKIEKVSSKETNLFESQVYLSQRDYSHDKLLIGFKLNRKVQFELEVGDTLETRESDLKVTGYTPTRYRLSDKLIGFSIRYQFID
ncbi:MAG: hypothetical protein OEY59_08965, partial [Deltaproteobacteria bacterium]|nr:hypothetical protein [Deltaproteobacteria bacterium]